MNDVSNASFHDELFAANEAAARYYRERLLDPAAEGPRRYLTARGFEAALGPTSWTVGYAPGGWTTLRDHLTSSGFSDETLVAAGLACTTRRGGHVDRFRDRITFGIRNRSGQIVGFTARCAPGAPDTVPKYLNTNRTAVYDKASALFGLGEQAHRLQDGANLVLVEGPLDALAVDLASSTSDARLAPLATCGTALTPQHGATIGSLARGHLIVAFDQDRAGRLATERAYETLRPYTATLFASCLPSGQDPAEALTRLRADGLQRDLVQLRPLADMIVDNHIQTWPNLRDNAEARVACLRDVARVVARMDPEDLTRESQRLTAMLGLEQRTITRELTNRISTSTPDSPRASNAWSQAFPTRQ